MNLSCVTTLNKSYYDRIGKYMIDSWIKYWPKNASLTIYTENFSVPISDNRIKNLDWDKYCSVNFDEFSKKIDDIQTLRFSKKGFSFLNFLENYNSDSYIVWLDADLLFKKPITEQLITSLLPKEKLLATFDCYYQSNPKYTFEEYKNYNLRTAIAAESGFVIVNPTHYKFNTYIKNYRDLYTSDKKHKSLTSWYDGEVLLSAAREFLDQVEDLSQLRTTDKTQTPLNRSYLSEYMIHAKGKVKKSLSNEDFERIVNDIS